MPVFKATALQAVVVYFMKPRPMAVRRWEAPPIQRDVVRKANKLSFREGPEGQEGELRCMSGKVRPMCDGTASTTL